MAIAAVDPIEIGDEQTGKMPMLKILSAIVANAPIVGSAGKTVSAYCWLLDVK
ncbi:hypothetical protein [Austwickia sp. TVS 96-490-7B]|uniref:hypothetical protein n=1 Tax=Austwickia sp. TVS 96-490-7B TaxID=2830843 RepID=UPI001C59A3CF|nr:hypothetical protein [Austwickia sp. TVS 96-490-7B]